jgi:hypothetical protein
MAWLPVCAGKEESILPMLYAFLTYTFCRKYCPFIANDNFFVRFEGMRPSPRTPDRGPGQALIRGPDSGFLPRFSPG